ncbi:hypothetical protein IEQ34_021273 [Dendrobium chrysotoxum]|uniref:Uncharacterized protein n=1 Tax=Dendrobium chrysotoxum TaxID=161865 RepID=A0AAV7G2M7_DENCH|nr:hypothetical protein IEQ34_021273 [Dendrobium chrysotoxum]
MHKTITIVRDDPAIVQDDAAEARYTNWLITKPLIPEHGFLNPTHPILQTISARDLLCGPNSGVRWKTRKERIINFPASYVTQTSKAWHYFNFSHILPTKNISEITKERALLNFFHFKWLLY